MGVSGYVQVRGVLHKGRQAVLAALYTITGEGWPGTCPATEGLARRASGGVGRLVHDHRLRRAWYLPGDGGLAQRASDGIG